MKTPLKIGLCLTIATIVVTVLLIKNFLILEIGPPNKSPFIDQMRHTDYKSKDSVSALKANIIEAYKSKSLDGSLNEWGDTALHYAVQYANKEVVEEMLRLNNGKDINTKNSRGDTPLDDAKFLKKKDIYNLLLKRHKKH